MESTTVDVDRLQKFVSEISNLKLKKPFHIDPHDVTALLFTISSLDSEIKTKDAISLDENYDDTDYEEEYPIGFESCPPDGWKPHVSDGYLPVPDYDGEKTANLPPVEIKQEDISVVIPEKGKSVCSCGKVCASDFGLMAHQRHCKLIVGTKKPVKRVPEGKNPRNSRMSYQRRSNRAKNTKSISLNFRLKAQKQAQMAFNSHKIKCHKKQCVVCNSLSKRLELATSMAS